MFSSMLSLLVCAVVLSASALEHQKAGREAVSARALREVNTEFRHDGQLKDVNGLIRGVNLGGWLVLEPWITPSLFDQFPASDGVVDQWTFCEHLGADACTSQLALHWNAFLNEKDIIAIAAANLTHIRIPVGYWIFGDILPGEPWVTGEIPFLNAALDWAKVHGLDVVLDLHCGPGSQNGFDNSGKKGPIHWADTATNATDGSTYYPNVDRTVRFLKQAVRTFGDRIWAMELLNEPFLTIPLDVVHDFYIRSYSAIRSIDPNMNILIQDSFRFADTNVWLQPPEYNDVWIDTHIYQVFDVDRLKMTPQQHLDRTCGSDRATVSASFLPSVTGEWSLATTDCAKWLNGFNTGSRYDGTFPPNVVVGSCKGKNSTDGWTQEYRDYLLTFAELQMDAYESGNSTGWFFWNFKTEQAPEWNYLLGVEQGYIPSDHSNRSHSCSNGVTDGPPPPRMAAFLS